MGFIFGIPKENATTEWIVWSTLYFCMITLITHTITDYFTSRLNSKLWAGGKVHYFFVSVGFDQVLHYGQLFLTYHYLFHYLVYSVKIFFYFNVLNKSTVFF